MRTTLFTVEVEARADSSESRIQEAVLGYFRRQVGLVGTTEDGKGVTIASVDLNVSKVLVVPSVHLNGTSRESLMDQVEKAERAVRNALMSLYETAPNGRDYYPQGNDALKAAQRQHDSRVGRLLVVANELGELALGIADAP